MSRRALIVLMWKHLMVRKRRFIHTIADFLIPIMFFCLLFHFGSYLKPPPPKSLMIEDYDYKIQYPDVLPLSDVPAPRRVLYYPSNSLTDTLMHEVGRKLDFGQLKFLPDHEKGHTNVKGYYGAKDVGEITKYLPEMYKNIAVVFFHNINDEVWPANLNYSIGMKNMFFTNSYEATTGIAKPHREFGEVYEEFLRLQWAIDTSYIKVVTNNDVNQTISMQEFPYYGSKMSDAPETVCLISALLCSIAMFTPFVFLMSRLLEERSTGIQELIKMSGVSSNTISFSHFLNVLPVGLFFAMMVTVLLKAGPTQLVEFSSGSSIFIVMILHYISIICLAFACSFLMESTQYSISISVFAYVASWMPTQLLSEANLPTTALVLSGIFPHTPVSWFWKEIASFEKYGEGWSWSDAIASHTPKSGSVALAIFWLLFQITLFTLLTWYLLIVRPGPYGIPQPWNFFFKREYWNKNEVRPQLHHDEEEHFARDDKYFETPPRHLDVGIKIENVSKVFPKHRALTNVSLDVYRGEICVLLGHNGAGKTTLMSIITGMMAPTEGAVYVNGVDTRRNKEQISREIGLCPQHNLFFPDLTVLEHAMFFALLKKGSYKEARKSCVDLMKELGLAEKVGTKSGELSGGMKRRLQLACALAGGAAVLVLDEPTAGLDVETRRALWDLLLSVRGSRTVLLSTHFMEEADALGDRVAALHHGRLRCTATTLHLKKAMGSGYRLSLTTSGAPREAAVSRAVAAAVPDAALTHHAVNSLTYTLPAASSDQFPRLFTMLEEKKGELGIESIGVGVSTLEEVFLKLCSDTDINMTDEEIDSQYTEPNYNKVRGLPLYWRQFLVLLRRQIKFCMSKKITFFLLQILMPVVMICAFTASSNGSQPAEQNKNLTLRLDMYKILDPKVLYNIQSKSANIDVLKQDYPKVQFQAISDSVAEGVLQTGKENIMEYNKYLAGIELNDTDAKVLYTSIFRHTAPVALNMLSNLLAAQYMPQATGRTITTFNYPVAAGTVRLDSRRKLVEPKAQDLCVTWALLVVFVTLASLINLAALPCKERARGSRHIHVMAGCPPLLHWGATLLAHVATSAAVLGVTLVCALYFLDRDATLDNAGAIGCVVVLMLLGILAFLASMYIVTFYLGERGTGIFLVICLIVFGLITPAIHAVLIFLDEPSLSLKAALVRLAGWLAPPHALTVAVVKVTHVARTNAYCQLNRDLCPAIPVHFDTKTCCAGGLPMCYFCMEDGSPGPEMIQLAVQFIVYMMIVILIQKGVLSQVFERVWNVTYRPQPAAPGDDLVRAEQAFVDKEIQRDTTEIERGGTAMLVHGVHKNYRKLCSSFPAVQGISFSLKEGECFGLLGVNGAGKSTTFKMLTVEECTTRGQIVANGYRTERDRGQYLRTLGYCPQFSGLDEFQTGRENLTLLLTCRGLDAMETESEVKSWIGVVGLEKYADRAVSGYSGGMSRRLGAAAALCVGARLALLDEPTAGVDVAARRRVWAALRRRATTRRSVLLTSHSMDEMEALCARIAIMAGGRLVALGSAQQLRARFALGHAVMLKLTHQPHLLGDEVDSAKSDRSKLKSDFSNKFNCVIKDEHATMLHYHINETLPYSNLFAAMEAMRDAYPGLLEDYSITETTLEEVFLSFAKEPNGEAKSGQPNGIV